MNPGKGLSAVAFVGLVAVGLSFKSDAKVGIDMVEPAQPAYNILQGVQEIKTYQQAL